MFSAQYDSLFLQEFPTVSQGPMVKPQQSYLDLTKANTQLKPSQLYFSWEADIGKNNVLLY